MASQNKSGGDWRGSNAHVTGAMVTIYGDRSIQTRSRHTFMFYNYSDKKKNVEVEYQNIVQKKVGGSYTEFVGQDKWFGDFNCPKPGEGEEFASYGDMDLWNEKGADQNRSWRSGTLAVGDYRLQCYTRIRPVGGAEELKPVENVYFSISDPD